jgi:replicative DNA helicase
MWDEIVAIDDEGDEQVYDLTVPDTHNFVAADVFVHNTSFALGMAAHAALHANKPVLLFSLEMGSLELSQRLLSAEARIDSRRVRTSGSTTTPTSPSWRCGPRPGACAARSATWAWWSSTTSSS